ncbi:MAG: hypothetical protein KatS3mg097_311 [Candidatus Parcubacteria bacterium]|nr:MAG: hypothetical protein KatS3mg097_311 [Candidatus Parcubacteria bacterium]
MKKYSIFIYLIIIVNILISSVFAQEGSVPVADSGVQATLSRIFAVLDTISSNLARELPIINVNIGRNLQTLIENQVGSSFADIERLNLYFNLTQDSSALLSSLEENTPSYQQEISDEGQKVGLIKALNQLPDILKCIPEGRRDSFKYFVMNYLQPYDLSLKGEEIIDAIPDCAQTSENPPVTSKIIIPYSLSLLNPFNMAYFLGNIHSPGTNPFNFQAPSIVIVNKSNETFEDIYYENLIQATESHLSIGRDLEVFKRFQEMGQIMPAFEKCESGDLIGDDRFTDSGEPLCGYRRILMSGEEARNVAYATKRNIYPFLSSMQESQALNTVVENMSNIFLPYNLSNVPVHPSSSVSENTFGNTDANISDEETDLTEDTVGDFFNRTVNDIPNPSNSGNPNSDSDLNITGLVNDVLDNGIVLNGLKFGDLRKKFCTKLEKDNKPGTGLIGNVTCMKDIIDGLNKLTQSRIKDLQRRHLTLSRGVNFFQGALNEINVANSKVADGCVGASEYLNRRQAFLDTASSKVNSMKVGIEAQFNILNTLMTLTGQFFYKAINFVNTAVSFALKIQDAINTILKMLKQDQTKMISDLLRKLLSFIPDFGSIDVALKALSSKLNIILSLMNLPSALSGILTDLLRNFNNILELFGTHIGEIQEFNKNISLIERQYLSQVSMLATMQRQASLYGVRVNMINEVASNSGGQFKCRLAKRNEARGSASAFLKLKNKKNYITYYSPQSQQNKGIFNALIANILSIKNIFEPKILTINLQ